MILHICSASGLDVRLEASPSTGESFPHLYEPLPVRAVVEVLPLEEALERAAAG
jgi:uncharacterized protein (DUF952 family)